MSKKGSEFKDFHFSKISGSPKYINKNTPPPYKNPNKLRLRIWNLKKNMKW